MKIFIPSIFILSLVIFSISCSEDVNLDPDNQAIIKNKISGYVQKGPFLNGTSISLGELTGTLTQTGKAFNAQISDNNGSFEINNIELVSNFISLRADGFYFNEITNAQSSAQLTLSALSNIINKSNINVNLLTHLEKPRVEYLTAGGTYFNTAKKQAQTEILNIFGIVKTDMTESELLDISRPGEDNAILLAISAILQGYLSVAELSELLANISTDIKEDGVLDNQTLCSALMNNAKTIKPDEIRENLENRFEYLELEATVPEFEKYISQFIESSDYEFTGNIQYPETGKHGVNILDKEKTAYTTGTYSMRAILPKGTSLKVKIKGEYHWYFPAFQDNTGWEKSDWLSDNSRFFTSTRTGEIDYEIMLESFFDNPPGTYTNQVEIMVYENGAEEPTWTKIIALTDAPDYNVFNFPDNSPMGPNLLNLPDGAVLEKDTVCSVALLKVGIWDIDFTLNYSGDLDVGVATGWGFYDYEVNGNTIDFVLTGTNSGDYISEIAFYIVGTGTLHLTSNEMKIEPGGYLNRTYQVE